MGDNKCKVIVIINQSEGIGELSCWEVSKRKLKGKDKGERSVLVADGKCDGNRR
jgi:hypothetical protein